jgi:hypothetical protein
VAKAAEHASSTGSNAHFQGNCEWRIFNMFMWHRARSSPLRRTACATPCNPNMDNGPYSAIKTWTRHWTRYDTIPGYSTGCSTWYSTTCSNTCNELGANELGSVLATGPVQGLGEVRCRRRHTCGLVTTKNVWFNSSCP